jgi:hypothetical protein
MSSSSSSFQYTPSAYGFVSDLNFFLVSSLIFPFKISHREVLFQKLELRGDLQEIK